MERYRKSHFVDFSSATAYVHMSVTEQSETRAFTSYLHGPLLLPYTIQYNNVINYTFI